MLINKHVGNTRFHFWMNVSHDVFSVMQANWSSWKTLANSFKTNRQKRGNGI